MYYEMDQNLKKSIIESITRYDSSGKKESMIFFQTLVNIFFDEMKVSSINLLSRFTYAYFLAITVYKDAQRGESMLENCSSKDSLGYIIESVLLPEGLKGNEKAIELIAFIDSDTSEREVEKQAKDALISISKRNDLRLRVANAVKENIGKYTANRISLLAEIDADTAVSLAVDWIREYDGDKVEYALSAACSMDLTRKQVAELLSACNYGKKDLIKSDIDKRIHYYNLVGKALQKKVFSKEKLKKFILEAIEFEYSGQGLNKLWEMLKKVEKNPTDQFGKHLLRMIRRYQYRFMWYDDFLNNFVNLISNKEKLGFLSRILNNASDDGLIWDYSQKIIALSGKNTQLAKKYLLKALSNKKRIATLIQLLARIRSGERNWKYMRNIPQKRLFSVTDILFEFLVSEKNKEKQILVINEIVEHGPRSDFGRVIPYLKKIALNNKSPLQGRAIRLLLVCQAREPAKSVCAQCNNILDDAAVANRNKIISIMERVSLDDDRTYLMDPLTIPAINFLAREPAQDRIDAIARILNRKRTDHGDIDMDYYSLCINHLKQFAISGNTAAAQAIIKKNAVAIWNESVPNALIDIYDKTGIQKMKSIIVEGAAKRFVASMNKNEGREKKLSPYFEIATISHFRDIPAVQAAFLRGIKQIEKTEYLDNGMATIIDEALFIFKNGSKESIRDALVKLADNMTQRIQKSPCGSCKKDVEQSLLAQINRTILKLV